jgi:hypothetical protein
MCFLFTMSDIGFVSGKPKTSPHAPTPISPRTSLWGFQHPSETDLHRTRAMARDKAKERRERSWATAVHKPKPRELNVADDRVQAASLRDDTHLVEPDGIEPTTSCLQSTRSPN